MVRTVMKHLFLLRGQGTVWQHMMFKGPRTECGRNAGANSGTAMTLRAGLLALGRLCPLRPGAFVGSHARLATNTGWAVRDLKVAFLLTALRSF